MADWQSMAFDLLDTLGQDESALWDTFLENYEKEHGTMRDEAMFAAVAAFCFTWDNARKATNAAT